jgi:hypothetical protein
MSLGTDGTAAVRFPKGARFLSLASRPDLTPYKLGRSPWWRAASTSETSVNFYQTTRRNNPEDSHLHTRCSENLKSRPRRANFTLSNLKKDYTYKSSWPTIKPRTSEMQSRNATRYTEAFGFTNCIDHYKGQAHKGQCLRTMSVQKLVNPGLHVSHKSK